MSDSIRTFAVLIAAAFAILTPVAQYARAFGLSAAEFSSDGDSTLRAAPYAFSIWGLIYLGLAAFAIYQAIQQRLDAALLNRFVWPSVISMCGCGLWLMAAAADLKWATVLIIVVSAAALLFALAKAPVRASGLDAWLIVAPLALLAGWLTLASTLNALTVLTAFGFVTNATATIWAACGLIATCLVAGGVALRSGTALYLAPIVWGLVAVFVAEQTHRPTSAWIALIGAALFAVLSVYLWARSTQV